MKSPFPGMDPYLEQYWRDVHHSLITYTRDRLQPALPGELRARVEERVFVESDSPEIRTVSPDVHVIEHGRTFGPAATPSGGLATAEPLVIHVDDEPVTQGYIEIVDAGSGNRVITVIEFLSPSNKLPGDGQDLYLRKQREVREAGVSLVEIDLTRTGRRVLAVNVPRLPRTHHTTYLVCVRRGWRRIEAEVYRAPLTEPLPTIRIPLRQTDADVQVDLQALIEQAYHNGRYDDLNYRAELDPPLDPPDAVWADQLLRSQGLR